MGLPEADMGPFVSCPALPARAPTGSHRLRFPAAQCSPLRTHSTGRRDKPS